VDHENEIVVHASLPGVDPDHVEVDLQGDVVNIRGTYGAHADSGTWLVRERAGGSFQRAVTLPFRVDPEGAEADFDRGVLTLRFPKAGEAPHRRISVRTGTSMGGRTLTGFDDQPATTHVESGTEPRDPEADIVDEASIDSFPASDPPAYGGAHRV